MTVYYLATLYLIKHMDPTVILPMHYVNHYRRRTENVIF